MKIEVNFEKRDIWIGMYWERTSTAFDAWICFLPCITVHVTILRATSEQTERERILELTRELQNEQEGSNDKEPDKYEIHCQTCGIVSTAKSVSVAMIECISKEPCWVCHKPRLSIQHSETHENVTGPFTRTQRRKLK